MKRTLIATTLCALSLAAMPARAGTLPGPEPATNGTIQVPSGAARAQRCATQYSVANGTFGWILSVTPGMTFTLTTPTPSMDDINIGFYTSITSCETAAAIAGAYANHFGNESGTVPNGATKAIIYSGSVPAPPEHTGYARPNTPFTYTQS